MYQRRILGTSWDEWVFRDLPEPQVSKGTAPWRRTLCIYSRHDPVVPRRPREVNSSSQLPDYSSLVFGAWFQLLGLLSRTFHRPISYRAVGEIKYSFHYIFSWILKSHRLVPQAQARICTSIEVPCEDAKINTHTLQSQPSVNTTRISLSSNSRFPRHKSTRLSSGLKSSRQNGPLETSLIVNSTSISLFKGTRTSSYNPSSVSFHSPTHSKIPFQVSAEIKDVRS